MLVTTGMNHRSDRRLRYECATATMQVESVAADWILFPKVLPQARCRARDHKVVPEGLRREPDGHLNDRAMPSEPVDLEAKVPSGRQSLECSHELVVVGAPR